MSDDRQQLLADAIAHHAAGRWDDAEGIGRLLLERDNGDADAMHLLGVIAHARHDEPSAVKWMEAAVARQGDQPVFHNNLGEIYFSLGRLTDAGRCFRRAVELRPDFARALGNLGNVLQATRDLEAAGRSYQAAVALDPRAPHLRCNFGKLLLDTGFFHAAETQYRAAIALQPNYAKAIDGLAQVLVSQRRHEEAVAACKRATEIDPSPVYHSNLLLHLHYTSKHTPAEVATEHRAWATRFVANVPRRAHARRHADRPRVALLSPDLCGHPVGRFVLPLLQHYDRERMEVFVFSDTHRPDAQTGLLKSLADRWIDSSRYPDAQLADNLHLFHIDIAIDLAGHTGTNRLCALAGKPAPVQMTYLGYPNTTGAPAIDYRITDAIADPPGENDDLYTEQLLRLPTCAWCWTISDELPPVSSLPAVSNGFVTFGSLNNIRKISANTLDLWSAALAAVPRSRLLVKTMGFQEEQGRQSLLRDLAARGIASDRIALLPTVRDYRDHLATYGQIDIALDTFPYAGTTTTCEALSMGVPVITLAGNAHVSRVGASILTAAGMQQCVTKTRERFAATAVALASDFAALAAFRATLRPTLARSPLCDGPRFAREFTDAISSAL